MLLTQKRDYEFNANSLGETSERDLYKAEWERVQSLSRIFWVRWRKEYLPLLQQSHKWTDVQRDMTKGDVIYQY
jgi:hypothetical protein